MSAAGLGGVPPIHHVGYVVDDLAAGVERAVATLGAGPFFAIEHVPFDAVTFEGEPAAYDHSSAFGVWGPLLMEITVVHDAQPAGLAEAFVAPGGGIGHVAWLAADLEAETARLTALGCEPFHTGRSGPVSAVWFHGGPLLAHPIEVLQRVDPILGFYAMLRESAQGWDGTDPLRQAP